MSNMGINRWQMIQAGLLLLAVTASAVVFVGFFQQIPIESGAMAIDWKKIWPAIEGGTVRYAAGIIMNPPWSALLVSPLGLLSMRASWGLLAFITTLVLIISVPRTPRRGWYWLSILLLVMSFPALRHMIDGNFEVLIISGALLTVAGYRQRRAWILAAGLLLIASKPQSGTLMIVMIGLYALLDLRHAETRSFWLKTGGLVAAVAVPFLLWKGAEWLDAMLSIPERSSIMDVSLMSALNRSGWLGSAVIMVIWLAFVAANLVIGWATRASLSREKAGMFIAASLLIAPYASGNSILTVMAVAIIPLFIARPLLGLILIAMIDCLFFWNREMLFQYQAYFQTLTLLVMWLVLAWRVMSGQDEPLRKILPVAASTR